MDNQNNNNNNGQGIFYGVIGVATLIVTIIGATFAFFSASANSDPNAITVDSATLELGFSNITTGLKENLIPVDETLTGFDAIPNITAESCKDVNDNNICSVYQFTVTNPSTTTAQRIYATLTPTTNTFTNLHYALFKGTATQILATSHDFDVDGTAVTATSNITKNTIGANGDLVIRDTQLVLNSRTPITLSPLEQVLDPTESVTYTMVLWIHETGANQTSLDSGKSFAAGLNFTTSSGSTGVTGVLSTTG